MSYEVGEKRVLVHILRVLHNARRKQCMVSISHVRLQVHESCETLDFP